MINTQYATKEDKENSQQLKKNRMGLPSMWMTLLFLIGGIYGTGTLYQALISKQWTTGLLGFAIMIAAVSFLGTPLAFARYLKWAAKHKK